MAYKLKVNDVIYDLKDGISIKEEFNETLDSATAQFVYYCTDLDIVSFDYASIYDTDEKIDDLHLLVDSYDDEVFSFGDSIDSDSHTYTMSFFSETKELERITLPNCSVTQPLTGTKKTVTNQIRRFVETFMPKIKVYSQTNTRKWVYEPMIKVDGSVYSKFLNVECPEFQWNEPTLREVLNDLFSTKDCIVVVKNHTIYYYDLTEKRNPIDTSKLTYSKRTMNSSDYCGELTLNMQNAIGKNVTIVCEKKGLRTTEGEMTTSNAVFVTQQPIYKVKSCKVSYFMAGSVGVTVGVCYFKDVDITRYVVEKDEYDVASSGRYSPSSPRTEDDYENARGYKQYLLYYKRGSNMIQGWGETQKESWDSVRATSHIGWIIYLLEKQQANMDYQGDTYHFRGYTDDFAWKKVGTEFPYDLRGIHVDLVYETLSGHSMHVGKYLPVRHPENRLFDNQQNSYVDVNHQSIFEYAKANRLGNKIRTIHGEYFDKNDIPQLGDYIGDEILFSKELICYDNIVYFKGMLTPNYILKDYYTGVFAKKRSWQLAKAEDALLRCDIIKLYVEFSFVEKEDYINELDLNIVFTSNFSPNKLLDGLADYPSNQDVKYCLLKSKVKRTNTSMLPFNWCPDQSHSFQVDLDKEIQGMSLCFNFKTMDNVQVDYHCTMDNDNFVNSIYKYCDDDGELEDLVVGFAKSVDYTDGLTFPFDGQMWRDSNEAVIGKNDGNQMMQNVLNTINVKPKIHSCSIEPFDNSSVVGINFAIQRKVNKDNREIIQSSVQFEYCADNRDIIVTQRMIELCSLYNGNANDASTLKIFISTNPNDKYALTDKKAKGSVYQGVYYFTAVSRRSSRIQLNCSTTLESWCIADSSNNILLAVNGNKKTVYVNLLKTRDTNIYYSVEDRKIVGNIHGSYLTSLIQNVEAYEESLNEDE